MKLFLRIGKPFGIEISGPREISEAPGVRILRKECKFDIFAGEPDMGSRCLLGTSRPQKRVLWPNTPSQTGRIRRNSAQNL